MTCKHLMTSDPAYCLPEDNVVRAAMLMKQHNIGSVPVVSDSAGMQLAGIVTDRDLTLRVVAEQRDYYDTRIREVMSSDLVTCRDDDDSGEVLKAMANRQIRRVPVVDGQRRLVGIVSQADVALQADSEEVGEAILAISEPASMHQDRRGAALKNGLMIAGGLGIGAGLFYFSRTSQGAGFRLLTRK